jgi:hypothetical protein
MDKNTWQKVKTIFMEAAELPKKDRVKYINTACDDENIKKEIYSLLSANDTEENFLDVPIFLRDKYIN